MKPRTRKRWFWLLTPLIGCGAIFWARQRAWEKQEDKFRVAMRWWMTDIEHVNVWAAATSSRREVSGSWSTAEFLTTLDDLHLQRAQSGSKRGEPTLIIGFPSGVSARETSGFYVDLKNGRGWIDLPNQNSSEHWEKFEFTPKTCRLLEKRINALQEKDYELFMPK